MFSIIAFLRSYSPLFCFILVGVIYFCFNLKLGEKNDLIAIQVNQIADLKIQVVQKDGYIKMQNTAIDDLKIKAEQDNAYRQSLESQALEVLNLKDKGAIKDIDNASVPPDCIEATKWAAEQAQTMGQK